MGHVPAGPGGHGRHHRQQEQPRLQRLPGIHRTGWSSCTCAPRRSWYFLLYGHPLPTCSYLVCCTLIKERTGRSSARAQTQFVFSAIQPRPCMHSEIVWYTTYPGHDGNNKIWNFLRKGMCSCEKMSLTKNKLFIFSVEKM